MYAGAAYVVVVIDDAMSTAATAAMEGEIEEGFIIVVCLIQSMINYEGNNK